MYKYIPGVLLFLSFACKKGPEPIVYGKDQGAYCKMTISDPKFGAEIVTQKGRIYKFDAIECMIRFLKENPQDQPLIYATPYNRPNKLVEKDSLFFVISPEIRSPMGENLAAFSNRNFIDSLIGKEADIFTWEDIYDKIKLK